MHFQFAISAKARKKRECPTQHNCKSYEYFQNMKSRIYIEIDCYDYRRRIYTEEKAMVVAAVWGAELFQFLTALQIYCSERMTEEMDE